MPNGHPSKYWPNNPTTLISELTPACYQGELPRERTAGRGTGLDNSNIRTRNARQYLDETFRLLGGVDEFTKWAKAHPSEFYPLYIKARVPRPLPSVSDDEGEGGVTIIVQASTKSSSVPASSQASPSDGQESEPSAQSVLADEGPGYAPNFHREAGE